MKIIEILYKRNEIKRFDEQKEYRNTKKSKIHNKQNYCEWEISLLIYVNMNAAWKKDEMKQTNKK